MHNRYVRHKQAHLAHQEFITRVGTVSPVHIHQLEQLGDQRIKARRPGLQPNATEAAAASQGPSGENSTAVTPAVTPEDLLQLHQGMEI